ncbi:hypothetical protein [Pseudomonas viridiflava]|uniref:hypothetical protein n=1 Tax=Pseudomonas viridiflava TaxID=33069 RepID=UPI001F120A12|nr:hypothetical protein [Pseudomonas viridiflava]
MSKFLTPPTSAGLSCERKQPGLLGSGYQPFSGESAASFYMKVPNISGHYPVDDYTAALYLIHQLASPDEQLSAADAERAALLVRKLLRKLWAAKTVPVEALQSLQAAAESIPEIGPLMFSQGNLPGTVATISGAAMAVSQTRRVIDLLDLTADQKEKMRNWANSRGSQSARSASKVFRGAIRIISKGDNLFFEVPVTAAAKHHKVLGEVGKAVAHIPLGSPAAALSQRAPLHSFGATGRLGVVTGGPLAFILAIGPQGYLDWASSTTREEFKKKSLYSQPTNVASFLAGAATVFFLGVVFGSAIPLYAVIAASAVVGLAVQKAMSYYKADQIIGDYYTK